MHMIICLCAWSENLAVAHFFLAFYCAKQEVLLFPAMKPQDEPPAKGNYYYYY